MKIKEIISALKNYDENLEVNFLKGTTHQAIAVWDCHEWFLYEKRYQEERRNEQYLAILIDD
jgi:hypothetical protein